MKLGLQLGYWGAQPPENHAELVAAAEDAGFDTVFTAEAWGSDAYTPLAWWGRETKRMRLGTSVIQLSARTPTACAMAALTLDHLSGGRHILGLGVSGPQVVEGWYGAKFPKPLARTREYIDILRQVWAREAPVHSDGPHYPLPLSGDGTTGLGKNLKPITHPLRADIPVMLGAEGPKNVALAAEICDGWLPIFYSPRIAGMYNEWLDEGFARPGARRSREDFEICATAQVVVTDDRPAGHGADEAASGALHGRHGRRGHQLPRRRLPPHGLHRGGRRRHQALPVPTARTRPPRSFRTNSSTTRRSWATSTTCRSRSRPGKPRASR